MWKVLPIVILIFLAGLQSIPEEVYEAADVDGATKWQRFTRVTFPLLIPYMTMAIILRAIDAFRIFELALVLSGRIEPVLGTYIADRYLPPGVADPYTAAAASIVLFGIIMVFIILYLRFVAPRREGAGMSKRGADHAKGSPGPVLKVAFPIWVVGAVLLVLFPVYLIFLVSFAPGSALFGERPPLFITDFTLEWWQRVIEDGQLVSPLIKSLTVATASTALAILIAAPAAYVISRLRPAVGYTIVLVLLVTRMFPEFTIGISVATWFARFGMTDTYLGLILAHLIGSLPFIAWILVARSRPCRVIWRRLLTSTARHAWRRSSGSCSRWRHPASPSRRCSSGSTRGTSSCTRGS